MPANVPAAATAPAGAGGINTGDEAGRNILRSEVLYEDPNAAFMNALRAQGIDPYRSYFANQLRRRYGNAARGLFELRSLAGPDTTNTPGAAAAALSANMNQFQDFVNGLVSGIAGGQTLNQAIGFNPAEAARAAFAGGGGPGDARGLGWSRFTEGGPGEVSSVNTAAMRRYLQELQGMLLSLSGANPAYARALAARTNELASQWNADYAAGAFDTTGKDFGWLDIIMNRL